MAAVASHPAVRPASTRQPSAITTQPTSGQSRMSQPAVVALTPASPLELAQLVHVDGQLAPVDGHDQTEPDRHLTGRHHHHDEREDLPVLASPHACERDQGEVGAVQHQLQAEQEDERVAPGEDAAGPDAEDDRRDGQIPTDGHYQPPSRDGDGAGAPSGEPRPAPLSTAGSLGSAGPTRIPVLSAIVPVQTGRGAPTPSSWSSPPRPSSPRRRRASTIAPTAATMSRIEASSNGNRYLVRNSVPMCFGVPNPST